MTIDEQRERCLTHHNLTDYDGSHHTHAMDGFCHFQPGHVSVGAAEEIPPRAGRPECIYSIAIYAIYR